MQGSPSPVAPALFPMSLLPTRATRRRVRPRRSPVGPSQIARLLDMKLTLDENGIPDDTDEFEDLNIDPDFYIPTIQLYFSDDLTIA